MDCSPCKAGMRRLLPCSELDTVCIPCSEGTYSSEKSKSTQCRSCTGRCKKVNEEIVHHCSSTRDTVCQCKQGYWLKGARDIACERHKTCPPGSGVRIAGSPTSDTVCQLCTSGTFSPHHSSYDRCKKHSRCDYLGGVKKYGDSQSDNICKISGKTSRASANGFVIGISLLSVILLLLVAGVIFYIYLKKRGRWDDCKNRFLRHSIKKSSPVHNSNPPSYGQGEMNDLEKLNCEVDGGTPLMSANIEDDVANLNTETKASNIFDKNMSLHHDSNITEVFQLLSMKIPCDHPFFIHLPGALNTEETQAILYENMNAESRIVVYEVLQAWKQKSPAQVNINNIQATLNHRNVNLGHIAAILKPVV